MREGGGKICVTFAGEAPAWGIRIKIYKKGRAYRAKADSAARGAYRPLGR